MAHMTGRVFTDLAGYTYREHRPGWFRRDGAPITEATEHLFVLLPPEAVQTWIDEGTYVIEEEPM